MWSVSYVMAVEPWVEIFLLSSGLEKYKDKKLMELALHREQHNTMHLDLKLEVMTH
jgi:hypothetical protein